MLDFPAEAPALTEAQEAADLAGLRYVSDERPGIRRRKAGGGLIYFLRTARGSPTVKH